MTRHAIVAYPVLLATIRESHINRNHDLMLQAQLVPVLVVQVIGPPVLEAQVHIQESAKTLRKNQRSVL